MRVQERHVGHELAEHLAWVMGIGHHRGEQAEQHRAGQLAMRIRIPVLVNDRLDRRLGELADDRAQGFRVLHVSVSV